MNNRREMTKYMKIIADDHIENVVRPIDGWEAKATPALVRMTPAERAEIVVGIDRLIRSGYSPDVEHASYDMDEVCGLPDGTCARLYLIEWGPMTD